MKDPTDILFSDLVLTIVGLFALCMVIWVLWETLPYWIR